MAISITPLSLVIESIESKKNFVLQGGAGSGKTETLSQLLAALILEKPSIRIACITHTNKAADEIASRTSGDSHFVGTIHSFINKLICPYKKNIHKVISKLFEIESIINYDLNSETASKEQIKERYETYKRTYQKYSAIFFIVKNIRLEKAVGKRLYDAESNRYDKELNEAINLLNNEIRLLINAKDFRKIKYNETRFNDFHGLTYGHDGLLSISYWLIKKFPMLGRMVVDKFDCIFVDEYQDTDEKIVSFFLDLPKNGKTTLGFFGDSMQSIYGSGVGSLDSFIKSGQLVKIEKEDNYRCSQQVVQFINKLRDDGLVQEVAFKTVGQIKETIADRQGEVEIYYSEFEKKPHARSTEIEKAAYAKALDFLVARASFKTDSKTLLLREFNYEVQDRI